MTPAQSIPGLMPDLDGPAFITEQPKAKQAFCVVFAGDTITNRQKKAPLYRLGGKLFPLGDFKTVPFGVVKRCELTRLRDGMREVHSNLIDPQQHDKYFKSYIAKQHFNPETARFEEKEVGFVVKPHPETGIPTKFWNGRLYKPINPVSEIGAIMRRDVVQISGEASDFNGVVQVPGLENGAAIREAQLHYFPNWLQILTGQAELPFVLRQLEDQIRERQARTSDETLRDVGAALIASCEQFREWGSSYIAFQLARMEEVKTQGGIRHDEIAERLFPMLEITRKDELVKDFARQQNDSAGISQQLVETLSKNQANTDSVLAVMVQLLSDRGIIPATQQPAAPANLDQAASEFEQSTTDDSGFVDMSAETVADPTAEGSEEIVDEYLARMAAGDDADEE
jgi:hypothetical protein